MAAPPPPGWGLQLNQAPQPPPGWSTTPGQGGQPGYYQQQQQPGYYQQQPVYQNQVQQMIQQQPAQQPQAPPAPTYPLIWPNGIGWTSRNLADGKDPRECRPFFGCCLLPYQFHDKDLTMHGEPGNRSISCGGGWDMENADLIGKRFNFELRGGPYCCSDQINVYEGSQLISQTIIKSPCSPASWKCEVEDIVVVRDATGTDRFARRDSVCCQKNFGRYTSDGTFGWRTLRHPFYPANSQVKLSLAKATGFVTFRYHMCMPCYFQFTGFDEVPNTLTPDEQKMILGLILDPSIEKAPVDNNRK